MNKQSMDKVSNYAAFLAIVEVGIGSFVHGLKLPFGGQALSVNQGAVLAHATRNIKNRLLVSLMMISTLSAVLKSLSPAGNKLGPMLSISMQGFLYVLGVTLLGANVFGVALGMILLSVWAFVQPFVTLYIFYGSNLIEAGNFYAAKMSEKFSIGAEELIGGLLVIVAIKAVVAATLGVAVFLRPSLTGKFYDRLPQNNALGGLLNNRDKQASFGKVCLLVLKDLTKPLFLVSYALIFIFILHSKSDWSQTIWLSLRPLAIAFVFFFICRSPWFYKFGNYLRRYEFMKPFFAAFDLTIKKITNNL